MACSRLYGSLKLPEAAHSSLDLLIPSPGSSCSISTQKSRHGVHCMQLTILEETEKWEIALPSAWGFLPLPALAHICCPFEDALELLQEPSLTLSPLTALGAASQCYPCSLCLFLSFYLTTAAATHQGLPGCQTLS